MAQRVVVFVDAQNTYRSARRAFFTEKDPHVFGTITPRGLGDLVVGRQRPGEDRELAEVRVYTGRPDSSKQPKSYAPHMKQCAAWESQDKVTVVARTLRYPYNWPKEREREKGIDVAIAIDFVTMAMDNMYDVGVLVSGDSDLRPALEYVATHSNPGKTVEVAAWVSPQHKSRLRVPGMDVWCHLLDRASYDSIYDHTDYRPA